jgi:hypothetical protein
MIASPFVRAVCRSLPAVVLAFTLASCGESRKPVYPVRGKALFRGSPAAGALVIFSPVGESDPNVVKPQGMVANDGSFEISTYGEKDGAPAGEYNVAFVWTVEEPKTKREWSPLPARYMSPEMSGIRVTVREGANDLQPFALPR